MSKTLGYKIACTVLSVLFISQISAGAKPDIKAIKKRAKGKGYTFEVGYNPAADYSLEQICGFKPSKKPFPKKLKSILPPQDLPDQLDWRQLDGCTPVKNQGSCGSCWAFAAMGVAESQYLIRSNLVMDFSEQWLVSCTNAGSCGGGNYGPAFSYMIDAIESCNDTGTYLESAYPYEVRDADCVCPPDERFLMTSWAGVSGDIASMKQAIMTYGPIAVAVAADDLFHCYIGGIFNANASTATNHAVVLVGWDDTQGANGIWYLRNSWGTGWGEGGYMRIEYGCNLVGTDPAYAEFIPDNEPNMLNVPDPYPTIASALALAGNGDIITLGPGIYTGPGNTDLNFGGHNVTIRSINPSDPNIIASTVIDCQGTSVDPHRAFLFDQGEDPNAMVYGVTIRNGYVNDNGGAVYCYYSSPTFKNCVFENNTAAVSFK